MSEAVAPETPVEDAKVVHVAGELIASLPGAVALSEAMSDEDRADALRTAAKLCTEGEARLGLVQGEALFELSANGGWKTFRDESGMSYATFEDWVKAELGCTPKTAYNRINTYKALVINGGLTAADLAGVKNWSSIPLIAKYVTPETAADLVAQVKALSFRDVQRLAEHLKGQETVDVTAAVTAVAADKAAEATARLAAPEAAPAAPAAAAPAPDTADASEKASTLKITGAATQIATIREAISLACTLQATQSDAAALEAMATEYLVEHAGEGGELSDTEKMALLATIIAKIESRFGVTLTPSGLSTPTSV